MNTRGIGDKIREIVLASANDALEAYTDNFLSRKCESPIEQLMMAAFFAEHLNFFTYPSFFVIFHADYKDKDLRGILAHSKELMEFGRLDCLVWPQAPIGPYRVDFLCVGIDYMNGQSVALAIECDGHDFHERTKEQAKRDKERDRYLISNDIPTMRFTGSEIWKDARGCVKEVGRYYQGIEYRRSVAC